MTMCLNYKVNEEIEWGYRNLLKHYGPAQSSEMIEANNKFKGKMLMGLKEYPRLNLKRAFWRWFIRSTGSGEELILHAANQLVLYTNINKTTSFYRLLGTVRSKTRRVHPRVKRMTTMLYLYLRMYFDRTKKYAFDHLKVEGKSKKVFALDRLFELARKRKISAFKIWMAEAKKLKEAENKKK